jgi:hypothetical protein
MTNLKTRETNAPKNQKYPPIEHKTPMNNNSQGTAFKIAAAAIFAALVATAYDYPKNIRL